MARHTALRMKREDVTPELVRSFFSYQKKTGYLIWKRHPAASPYWNKRWGGKRARGHVSHGYLRIMICRKPFMMHRVAYAIVMGEWPPAELDHEKGVRCDNRWEKLRPATHQQNSYNRVLNATNTSGAKGICWHRRTNKWMARIAADGQERYLGVFADKASAQAAYAKAAAELHGKFASPQPPVSPEPAQAA